MSANQNPRTLVLLTLVAFVVGGGLTYWQYTSMSAASEKVATLRQKLSDADKLKAQVQETAKKLTESQQQLEHLEKGVPDLAYIPTLLTDIEKTGAGCGLQVTGVRPKEIKPDPPQQTSDGKKVEEPKKPYDEIEIEVGGRGSFASVQSFISAMNQFPKIMSVKSLDLAPKKEDGKDSGMLDAKVTLRAYLFKQAKPAEDGKTEKLAEGTNSGATS